MAIAFSAKAAANLPLAMGGLGLRSAVKLRHAAHWVNWADAIQMIAERHSENAGTIIRAIHTEHEAPSVQAIVISQRSVEADGFVCPSWEDLATGEVSASSEEDEDPNQPSESWQSKAARKVEARSFARLLGTLTDPQKALLWSQGGPLASVPFISMPIDRVSRIDSQSSRLLFLRRLRQPLPLIVRSCRCGRLLDCLGHHRSACPVAGVLGRRGFPLENVAARICREAGGRVRTNVFVRDLDLPVFNNVDERRLEVFVDGFPLFRGAQLAIDTTLVCPLTREGVAKPRWATENGGASLVRACTLKERRYPEVAGAEGRARLVVLGGEVGGRFSDETAHFLRSLASAKVRGMSELLKGRAHAALMRRWSSLLGCTAARSYALSLLDRVPAGAEGPIPSIHEVMRDHSHKL